MSEPVPLEGTRPLGPADAIALDRLSDWLRKQAPALGVLHEVRAFNGGNSNPTFQLTTSTGRYVLRRRPLGTLAPSAHAVDREYRILAALAGSDVPVPRVYALCTDPAVLGADFYVMDLVAGRVLWDLSLPGFAPAERMELYRSQVETIARLHAIDPDAIGLTGFGKAGNFAARQIDRWVRQYRASGELSRAMDQLIDRLSARIPEDRETRIAHGDLRLDNMVVAPHEPRIVALLDWELSTLGEPIADFAYFLMHWRLPEGERNSLAGVDLVALGIPTMEQALDLYTQATGRHAAALDWYIAYNMFRLAAIRAGMAARARAGTATSARARGAAATIEPLARAALAFV